MSDEDDFTLIDAQAAYSGVSALVELLGACPPGQQVTGIFIRSLLIDVRMHLENVVDAMRVAPPIQEVAASGVAP